MSGTPGPWNVHMEDGKPIEIRETSTQKLIATVYTGIADAKKIAAMGESVLEPEYNQVRRGTA